MKIAIVGFGLEGQAAYHYWKSDNDITILDQNPDLVVPEGTASQLGPDYLDNLDSFDLVVRSPYVRPELLKATAPEKVTSNSNEFLRVCPTKNVIGVTGTKGKGTTSTLITRMLEASGKRVHLGGNIGVPALNLLSNDIQPDDYVVLELSSYQLIDLKRSPHLAVCLMIAPEHLDWHADTQEYFSAKAQLFAHQTADDIAIYYHDNETARTIAAYGQGKKIPYFALPGAIVENNEIKIAGQTICRTDELKLLGKHNWQNVCAAVTVVWQISQDVEAIRSTVTGFTGLPFRLELRRTHNDVNYYNDSFASDPPATIAALNSITEPKVMIVGGYERGLSLSGMATAFVAANVRQVIVIGATKDRLAQAFRDAGFEKFTMSTSTTMEEIVRQAADAAQPGDAVVLSPGFASYDMFKNFEDRGNQFNAAVEAL